MSAVTTLSQNNPSVDPGGQVSITIKIRNSGSIVDRFDVDVVGPAAGWTRVDPPNISLFPGVEGTATITFAPPRASTPRAGILPFGIRVRPAADPSGSAVEEGRIAVTPFTSVAADVTPQTSRGSRVGRHRVVVENRGNAPSDVTVNAIDPDVRLKLSVVPPRSVVGPDERAEYNVRVEVDDPYPFGTPRQRPFQISVEPGRQAPIQLRPTLNQLPMLPGWIPPVAGVFALVAVLGIGSFLAKAGPFTPAATAAPSELAVASSAPPSAAASASAEASVAPSASAEASEAPTASPTPAPIKPSDFTLAVTGDDVTLGGGLTLICPTTDKACRKDVKTVALTMLNELQNPYTGQGIVSTTSLSVPNTLPLVMSSDRDFPWAQAGGAATGTTQTAVIDLGPLLANPPTFVYAVVTTADGIPHRFVVDASLAQQLFNELYQLPPQMSPIVAATPPPNITIGETLTTLNPWLWQQPFVLVSPNP